MTYLIFHERGLCTCCPILMGYGIEESYDGNYYPYHLHPTDSAVFFHIEDENGRDIAFPTIQQAIDYLPKEAKR